MQWYSLVILALLYCGEFLIVIHGKTINLHEKIVPSSRLQGAKPIRIEEAPYQVSLQSLGVHVCGGSIIGQRHVLSAGRCVFDETPSTLTIRAGTSVRQIGGSVHHVTRIYDYHFKIHPNGTLENDIVVLEIHPEFNFDETRQPLEIEHNQTLEYGSVAKVSGWGQVEGGFEPELLRALAVPIISNETCFKFLNTSDIGFGSKFCAGFLTVNGKGTCNMDEGGPLISQISNSTRQIGIVTRNIYRCSCALEGQPDFYTSVAYYSNWIYSIVDPDRITTVSPLSTTTTNSPTPSPITTTTTISPITSPPTTLPPF
ncbi:hypothetical protein QAD02_023398 [Eretmocerus hayati]|uniref:Uncharacterized protein n=1 Tax=Eretmocerus hayati TaxID=131215 RepID=A0ACC2PY71_9HYME|nr:hypothetical protein QAD02_023398 [Eretmocerus hayati]